MPITSIDNAAPTSESLHNHNCYAYLQLLSISDYVLSLIENISPNLAEKLKTARTGEYDATFAYADLYTQFFSTVEDNIETLFDKPRALLLDEATTDPTSIHKREALESFIFSIYDNNNHILEDTFAAIQHIPLRHTPSDDDIEAQIGSFVKDKGTRVNKQSKTPAQVGSAYGRFTAMIADDFKPQHTTSIATVRTYQHTETSSVKEYRFGTQGQRDQGMERVSPLFERWLSVLEHGVGRGTPGIAHIYFNNLGLDRTSVEGKKERALTRALHQLEDRHANMAVITLPAERGFMNLFDYKKTKDRLNFDEVKETFLQIAQQDPAAKQSIKDFYISDRVRQLVFQAEGQYSKAIERVQLEALLDKSFEAIGIEKGSPLSSAQRQAVWFHFNKFELPKHIINALSPQSINFSCKDAIDRGGVSSAYYQLMTSLEKQEPMSREEFDRALHAAPTMVKARGMNSHSKLIWNAVDYYINAHYETIKNDPKQSWLIEWRDLNCPHHRVAELLALRIEQTQKELERIQPKKALQERACRNAQDILAQIKQQSDLGVSGKRLLLETVTRTNQIILQPEDQANNERYRVLADKLAIKYPKLQVLAGMMKSLVAIALFLPSFGYSKKWFKEGVATTKAGLAVDIRKEMHLKMKEQLRERPPEKETAEDGIEKEASWAFGRRAD